MKKTITVASLIMGVGGLVVLIFSFLDFYSAKGASSISSNAWGGDIGLAPETLIPVLLGAAMLACVILDLVGVKLPAKVLTFDWKQIYATWGIAAAGIMLGWLFTSPESLDKGAGLIIMLIGSLAMAAGSIMNLLGMGANTVNIPQGGSSTPSTTPPGTTTSAPPPPPPGAGGPPPPPPPPR